MSVFDILGPEVWIWGKLGSPSHHALQPMIIDAAAFAVQPQGTRAGLGRSCSISQI